MRSKIFFLLLAVLSIFPTVLKCLAEEDAKYHSWGGQDKWILEEVFPGVTDGYFVDVGAWEAVVASNTKALEQSGWNGICVEPFPKNWSDRKCQLFETVVYDRPGKTIEFRLANELSGIDHHLTTYRNKIIDKPIIKLTTTTIGEILKKGNAPTYIHYVSVDTEGSEFEILSVFPFSKYKVGAFTIEHNFEKENRDKIRALLEKNGYRFVREQVTDDFYVAK